MSKPVATFYSHRGLASEQARTVASKTTFHRLEIFFGVQIAPPPALGSEVGHHTQVPKFANGFTDPCINTVKWIPRTLSASTEAVLIYILWGWKQVIANVPVE